MSKTESLSEFVQRIMRQSNLSMRDVHKQSGKKIAASYISRIVNGRVRNLSVDKIAILAEGLGVDAFEVFAAAYGKSPVNKSGVDPLLLLDTMQQALRNPDALEVLQRWLHLSPEDQASFLRWLRVLSEQPKGRKIKRSKKH
jgi:transcriptional regulator with XRE-family HTH domain